MQESPVQSPPKLTYMSSRPSPPDSGYSSLDHQISVGIPRLPNVKTRSKPDPHSPQFRLYLLTGIIVTVLIPFLGLPVVYLAWRSRRAYQQGHPVLASRLLNQAFLLTLLGACCTIMCLLGFFVMLFHDSCNAHISPISHQFPDARSSHNQLGSPETQGEHRLESHPSTSSSRPTLVVTPIGPLSGLTQAGLPVRSVIGNMSAGLLPLVEEHAEQRSPGP